MPRRPCKDAAQKQKAEQEARAAQLLHGSCCWANCVAVDAVRKNQFVSARSCKMVECVCSNPECQLTTIHACCLDALQPQMQQRLEKKVNKPLQKMSQKNATREGDWAFDNLWSGSEYEMVKSLCKCKCGKGTFCLIASTSDAGEEARTKKRQAIEEAAAKARREETMRREAEREAKRAETLRHAKEREAKQQARKGVNIGAPAFEPGSPWAFGESKADGVRALKPSTTKPPSGAQFSGLSRDFQPDALDAEAQTFLYKQPVPPPRRTANLAAPTKVCHYNSPYRPPCLHKPK